MTKSMYNAFRCAFVIEVDYLLSNSGCLPRDYTHVSQLEANWTYYPGLQYPLSRFAHWYLPSLLAVEQAALEVRPPINMRNLWRLPWYQRHFDRAPASHQPTQQR